MKSLNLNSKLIRYIERRARLIVLTTVFAVLAACAGNDEVQTEIQSLTEAYETAQEFIANGNYRRGVQIFEAIQARYGGWGITMSASSS